MRLNIIVATLEGCPFDRLDDPSFIEHLLHEAVRVGGFTLLHTYVHPFSPQGVTGAAVLSESHIAMHTWPENGTLFVDIATCSGDLATRRAFARICELVDHTAVRRQNVDYSSKEHRSTLKVREQQGAGFLRDPGAGARSASQHAPDPARRGPASHACRTGAGLLARSAR